MSKFNLKNRRGFTLVELLVVVLILAILMAVALPLYLESVKDASKKSCRANLQTIANANQAYKVQTRSATYNTTLANLNADLGATPICPDGTAASYSIVASGSGLDDGNGGTVDVPDGSFAVVCANHGAFVPGVSSK